MDKVLRELFIVSMASKLSTRTSTEFLVSPAFVVLSIDIRLIVMS